MQRVYQTDVHVREGQSGIIVATLRDQDGALVPLSVLEAVTVTLYHWFANEATVINERDAQDVLGVNGGEFFDSLQTMQDEDGNPVTFNFRWTYTPADTPFLRTDVAPHQTEAHIAHFRFTWDGGSKAIGHEVKMVVTNFRRFPAETP